MKCNVFAKLIPKFIEDSLELEDYDEFINHAKNCKDCKDELEIHYMIAVGLDRIENDSSKSFDIKGELESQLERYEAKADKIFKKQLYTRLFVMMAQACAIITAVLFWL